MAEIYKRVNFMMSGFKSVESAALLFKFVAALSRKLLFITYKNVEYVVCFHKVTVITPNV